MRVDGSVNAPVRMSLRSLLRGCGGSAPHALNGITRATVMDMLGATERPVSYDELLTADEVF